MPEPTDALNLAGTTIGGKYAVERAIGEGGFAVVYRATHLVWKRPVAIKVFKALVHVTPEERARFLEAFLREGSLLADLSERSAAICQARDVGMLTTPHGDELPYVVLEWLEGASLADVLGSEALSGAPAPPSNRRGRFSSRSRKRLPSPIVAASPIETSSRATSSWWAIREATTAP